MNDFWISFLTVINEMSPYLLLGFLIAGVLHVFVPKGFYARYLSSDNKFSVLYAALLGIPLPLCSCGVIPTAIGLKNERASKGAVASFLIDGVGVCCGASGCRLGDWYLRRIVGESFCRRCGRRYF